MGRVGAPGRGKRAGQELLAYGLAATEGRQESDPFADWAPRLRTAT